MLSNTIIRHTIDSPLLVITNIDIRYKYTQVNIFIAL